MCLYPTLMQNKKYLQTKKNGGIIPEMKDKRARTIEVECGRCIECMKKKKRNWQIRLQEELKNTENEKPLFITLTFRDEEIDKLCKETGTEESNAIATLAVRRFLERWRKKNKKSIKHWLITELGQNNTERIHLHGILWTNKEQEIENTWKYGNIWIGQYVNEKTINYIVKYVNKIDINHKQYYPRVLTTPGIGKKYLEREDSTKNKFKEKETNENYKLKNGTKIALPTYYRNKIYSEDEREKLWMNKLDEKIKWIGGEKIKLENKEELKSVLKYNRVLNERLGYGNNNKEWKKMPYNAKIKNK